MLSTYAQFDMFSVDGETGRNGHYEEKRGAVESQKESVTRMPEIHYYPHYRFLTGKKEVTPEKNPFGRSGASLR